jgi:hypothetical protein
MDIASILDAVTSHASASGLFESVNGHESISSPNTGGLSADVWFRSIAPYAGGSGLAATSGQLVLGLRIYASRLQQPSDAIDIQIVQAVDALLTAYSGDFSLDGLIREVDLLGEAGVALSADGGYLKQDDVSYRVATITLPLIINDLWEQAA